MTVEEQVSRGRVAVASFVGTAIEFYDFYMYGTAAALVFGKVFFPSFSSTAGTLASFATFGVGFIARPIGAILLGHFGDRVGRKKTLVASLLMMGLATFAVGLIPSYASIGVASPLLLVVARLIQGLGLGGEWGGAVLLATEYAPKGKRGLYSAFPQIGPAVGFILSSGLFLVLGETLSAGSFQSWGWRVPFLISAVLVAIGFFIRMRIAETPVFRAAQERAAAEREERGKVPFLELLRRQPKVLALATLAFILAHTVFYTVTTYALSYGTSVLGLNKNMMLIGTILAAAVMGAATPYFAVRSDRIGRRKVCLGATLAAAVWAFPMFWLLNTRQTALVIVALCVGLLCFAFLYGPMGAYLPELFATRYRFSGASFAYSASGIVGGGVSPLLATKWQSMTGSSWPTSLWMMGIALVAFGCVALLRETKDDSFGPGEVGAETADGAEARAAGAAGAAGASA
ncbi:MFS transporter [Phaeacidiphilus oryzae]|uniref:MFS transporter n=1 Tax=Phaeacidiphilus oryzae TaxID=348818 RepID=UPI00068C9015|nr:MFS transporter [Phaeacidiphilus oryzae]